MSPSPTVCRSFTSSSCFDPQETALKLKVLVQQNPNHQTRIHGGLGDSLFQTHPSNKSHYSQNDAHYHHLYSCNNNNNAMKAYSSSSRLSPKSLELCTENLGSETGADTMSIAAGFINQQPSGHKLVAESAESSKANAVMKFQKSPCDKGMIKKAKSCCPFPPPLTTMSGSSPLQVTRHRENGRLIIEAVERPLRNGVLQAQRGGGRLRLSFVSSPVEGGDAAAEEEEIRSEDEAVVGDGDGGVNNDDRNQRHQWMSIRCKEGRRGGDSNRDDGMNWNKPALWVVTS